MVKIPAEGRVPMGRSGNLGSPKARGSQKLGSMSKTHHGGRKRTQGSRGEGSKRQ